MSKKNIQSFFSREKKLDEFFDNDKPQSNHFEDAFKLIPEAIAVLNEDLKLVYLNADAEELLGFRLRSVMGRNHSDVFKLLNIKTQRPLQGLFVNEAIKAKDCTLVADENLSFPIKLNVIPMPSYEGEEGGLYYLLVFINISERKALESKLSSLETYDGITRLLNRKAFDASIKQLIDNSHKHNAKHVLAFFSIDQFQIMNDTLGYSGGDALIKSMAELINSNVNKSLDIVGRVGGNEFAVAFCECKLVSAIKSINKILKEVENYEFMSRGHQYSITMSAGFVLVDSESTSSTRVISEANLACNLASRRGGNNVCAYQAESKEVQKLEGNIEWVMILKRALQENRFYMFAQPIHLLKTGEYEKAFDHYELLIRLSDDDGNPISPVEFISAAEYYSMMPTIDRWVVRNVLQHLSQLPQQENPPTFAINLSGQSLNDHSFLEYVLQEVKSSGVDPRMLCFEITEQVAVEDLALVNSFISSLKGLGSKFSLDDFGTGVSSYGYLRSLDVDYLKIDGSFVKNIADDEVAKAMVQSISQVGHTMKLKVIAEYVENTEILEILREMGVDYGQGYHIGRPGPLEDVLNILKNSYGASA